MPVFSLGLSSRGDLSSGVPQASRGKAGLEEGSCRGQCLVWVASTREQVGVWVSHCGSQGSGEVWERIPGSCFQLAVRGCRGCAAP